MDGTDADPAPAEARAAEELLDVARRWAEAIVADDAARIAGFVADDWVMVDASGVSPRRRFLELVGAGELTHSAMDPVGPLRVRVYGDTAVVTGRVTNTAHHRGHRYDADEWTTDVFVRQGGRWACVLTHVTDAAP
ncbi:nuclear transport factor 2 family protein [Geodermatophilus marinus]|uniref:nuclear transport factor 2 family protein n=1 Tax=Geodermatophilus sp. LHW52908 TaxID=2303986 RepID=UPI0018F5003C|nr:nuclear transport factor 2 family protein [Geodermatophilus sp. LHW52908]